MDGLPVVIKLPHIAVSGLIKMVLVEERVICYVHMTAFVKSGPWFGVAGPK